MVLLPFSGYTMRQTGWNLHFQKNNFPLANTEFLQCNKMEHEILPHKCLAFLSCKNLILTCIQLQHSIFCIFMATFANQSLCHSMFHFHSLPFWLNLIHHFLANGMIFGEKNSYMRPVISSQSETFLHSQRITKASSNVLGVYKSSADTCQTATNLIFNKF